MYNKKAIYREDQRKCLGGHCFVLGHWLGHHCFRWISFHINYLLAIPGWDSPKGFRMNFPGGRGATFFELFRKLMRIELSNRECLFLRWFLIARFPTNIVIVCYMIFKNQDARCIALELHTSIIFVSECKTT